MIDVWLKAIKMVEEFRTPYILRGANPKDKHGRETAGTAAKNALLQRLGTEEERLIKKEALAFLHGLFDDVAFLVHVRQGAQIDVLHRLDAVTDRKVDWALVCTNKPTYSGSSVWL
jgi:hypothetical protein